LRTGTVIRKAETVFYDSLGLIMETVFGREEDYHWKK